MDSSYPGKPSDSPFIGSFNCSFRDECLYTHWFLSLQDDSQKIERWKQNYVQFRTHSATGDIPPVEYAQFQLNPEQPNFPLQVGII